MVRGYLSWAAFFMIAILGSNVRASDAEEARLSFELGQKLYKQRQFDEAIQQFITSDKLVPNSNVAFNIAVINKLAGQEALRKHEYSAADIHFIDAYNWTQRSAELLDRSRPDWSNADRDRKEALASLREKVAVVTIETTPASATIYLDRIDLGAVGHSPLQIAVTAGDHQAIAKLDGFDDGSSSFTSRVGQVVPIVLRLKRVASAPVVSSITPTTRSQYSPIRLFAFGSASLTVAAMIWQFRRKTLARKRSPSRAIPSTPYLFVSYAREDAAFAQKLSGALRARGVGIWIDESNLPPGVDWDREIDLAIERCSAMAVVISPSALNSNEVRGEFRAALDQQKPVIPLLVKDCELPRQLRTVEFLDFRSGKADDPERLAALSGFVTKPS
jgi:hypothetical protein